jgi:hypothetical protein
MRSVLRFIVNSCASSFTQRPDCLSPEFLWQALLAAPGAFAELFVLMIFAALHA